MIVLAFDTALGACSAGVWKDGAVIASEILVMPQGHAEALMPMIERVLQTSQLTYADIDRIAVTVGPGSFTGLRVGIATARGLAMAMNKPSVGVTTTEALAAAAPENERSDAAGLPRRILAAIDSKRGDVFAQLFNTDGVSLSNVVNTDFASLPEICGDGPLVVVGDAAEAAAGALAPHAFVSQGLPLCRIEAIARIAATRELTAEGPTPVYARAPDVTIGSGSGALRR